MRNALQLLLEQPKGTKPAVLDVPRIFQDRDFRKKLLNDTPNIFVREFWKKEAAVSRSTENRC